jgi:hypothetical protein
MFLLLDRKNVQLLRVSCDHEIQLKPLTRLNWQSLALPDAGLVAAHASYWRQLKRV